MADDEINRQIATAIEVLRKTIVLARQAEDSLAIEGITDAGQTLLFLYQARARALTTTEETT